jgi:hypothetical protein
MNQRDEDIALLEKVLHPGHAPELNPWEKKAYPEMLGTLKLGDQHQLTEKQRHFVQETWERVKPIDASAVPRGREVKTPAVLQDPKAALSRKPPRKA